jgi:hypothetical protein
MKKIFLLFAAVTILIPLRSALPQTLSDYISQVKGDTLIVKDYYDMNNQQNSLYWAMTLDTGNVPAGRVYELKANGYYPLQNNPTTLRNTVIVGENNTSIVKNGNAASRPPLICGADWQWGYNIAAIHVTHDLIVRNCNIILFPPSESEWGISYSIIFTDSANLKIIFDNCLVEHLTKDFLFITKPNYSVTLRNCYFVNMSGWPCRRSGGVLDCLTDLDTLLVENCTHIMGQGSMYRLRQGYKFKRIIFNHNTFVNSAGYTFMNPGYQNNVSLTNNIFINCNVQCFAPILSTMDVSETDAGNLPMGLVNVYPDSADVANNTPRKFLCQDNLVYWDPSLANMDSILNANKVNGATNWRSQKIIMNTRTDSMFKHLGPYSSAPYSYLVTDTWKNQLPAFTDTKDLFTTQLANLKTFALGTVDSNATIALPTWRLINTGSGDFLKPDWPIPVDLSYSDADLQTASLGHFPLGDLNWFPSQKTTWLAQRSQEYAAIAAAMGDPVDVRGPVNSMPAGFQLDQNYPNPFNPSTTIQYRLPTRSSVRLVIYNVLGQIVNELVNTEQQAGYQSVIWNANVSSGLYFYRLEATSLDNPSKRFVETKKMLLLK